MIYWDFNLVARFPKGFSILIRPLSAMDPRFRAIHTLETSEAGYPGSLWCLLSPLAIFHVKNRNSCFKTDIHYGYIKTVYKNTIISSAIHMHNIKTPAFPLFVRRDEYSHSPERRRQQNISQMTDWQIGYPTHFVIIPLHVTNPMSPAFPWFFALETARSKESSLVRESSFFTQRS